MLREIALGWALIIAFVGFIILDAIRRWIHGG